MSQSEAVKSVRQGRILLKGPLGQYESFLVQQTADGDVYYYLGAPARTKDGWVTLPPEHHANVTWRV